MPSEGHDAIANMLRQIDGLRPNENGEFDIASMRQGNEKMLAALPVPDGVTFETTDADGIAATWINTANPHTERTLLYLHGGAYVVGSMKSHRALAARIAQASHTRGFAIDYRLAPEHPFPAAVEDTITAYRFLLNQGIPANKIAIGGDSAGGGLAIASMVALKDAGYPLPAAGIALSPWVDLEANGESMQTKANVDPLLQRDEVLMLAKLYLNGADPKHPHASPIHADLGDLPPILIQVGTAEVLLDDAIRLTERARQAGVDIELQQFEDLVHVFQCFAPVPEALDAIEKLGNFLQKHL